MPLFSFKDRHDRPVFVEAAYAQPTYASVEIGRPSEADTPHIVQGILTRIRGIWPDKPITVVSPLDRGLLPPHCIAALAFSTQPAHDQAKNASELVLIWFTHQLPLADEWPELSGRLASAWSEYATDFDW